MGQRSSRSVEETPLNSILPLAEEYPPSGKILPGAYIIRNKASGTVLHLVSPYEYEIGERCDIVGWQQETADLETLGRQIWWVEWDDLHQGYVISNVNNKGMVLDVVGSRSLMFVSSRKTAGEEKVVCARPKVRSITSARSSRRNSVGSSTELVRREELLESPNGGDGMALTETSVGERIRSQRWVLKRTQPTSECFSIHNLLYPAIALDLDWGKTENGTKVQLCTKTGVNHQQWNFIIPPIPSMNPPMGSWVFIINNKTGNFLHHTDINYPPGCIKVPKWDGIGEKKEFWGMHWCFVLADDRVGPARWYIKNRLTGTMLEHWSGKKKGDSVKADSYLYTGTKEWKIQLLPAGPPVDGKFKAGLWGIVNADSECALDHYVGKSVQAYTTGTKDESKQWRLMEVTGPFVDYGAVALLSPPSAGPPLPTLSTSCTTLSVADYPANSTLQPLVMPSVSSFYYLEPSAWPLPACSPPSRDTIGHEERAFFDLLGRIETQLIVPAAHIAAPLRRASVTSVTSAPTTPGTVTPPISPKPRSTVLTPVTGFFDLISPRKSMVPTLSEKSTALVMSNAGYTNKTSLSLISPTCLYLSMPPPPMEYTRKRILAEAEGWTMWAFGYSKSSNSMTNWNSLVESHIVRHSDRRDRYIVSFFEGVAIIRELLNNYYESQMAILSTGESGVVVILPSRLAWLMMLATASLNRILKLRKAALEVDVDVFGRMGRERTMSEGQRAARVVDQWVVDELERVKKGWGRLDALCRAGIPTKSFVH